MSILFNGEWLVFDEVDVEYGIVIYRVLVGRI